MLEAQTHVQRLVANRLSTACYFTDHESPTISTRHTTITLKKAILYYDWNRLDSSRKRNSLASLNISSSCLADRTHTPSPEIQSFEPLQSMEERKKARRGNFQIFSDGIYGIKANVGQIFVVEFQALEEESIKATCQVYTLHWVLHNLDKRIKYNQLVFILLFIGVLKLPRQLYSICPRVFQKHT